MPYLAGLFIIIALLVLIIIVGKISAFGKQDKQKWLDHLQALKTKSHTDNLSELKEILIKSDSLLDDILKTTFPKAVNTADRYKRLETTFSLNRDEIDRLWQTHKTRNELVHNYDYELKDTEAKEKIQYYEKIINRILS